MTKKLRRLGGGYYLTKSGKAKYEPDIIKWAERFEKERGKPYGKWRVGFTKTKHFHVSTVFLGMDYSFGGKKPVLWETMVFENKLSTQPAVKIGSHKMGAMKYHKQVSAFGFFDRYETRKQAEAGHKKICLLVEGLEKAWAKKHKKYGKAKSSKTKSTSGNKK